MPKIINERVTPSSLINGTQNLVNVTVVTSNKCVENSTGKNNKAPHQKKQQ